MSVSPVGSSTNNYAYPSSTAKTSASQTMNFLQLFVEQLKDQDPMNPMDSNSLMTQEAQMSMVEQMTSMNTAITQLVQSQELGEASALLGKQVTVQGDQGSVSGQVQKVAVVNQQVQLFINGNGYAMNQVTEVS